MSRPDPPRTQAAPLSEPTDAQGAELGSAAVTAPVRESDATVARSVGARRVKLTAFRVDPRSVLKMSFVLSVGVGIAGVALVIVLWVALSGMGVFTAVNAALVGVLSSGAAKFNLMDYLGFAKVVSLSIVIAVIDVLLISAISTLVAIVYNVCSSLVGGLHLTLTDDE
ncbi:MAG: DUF3566 domain-containing protein [Propionibacteriaceae bacterium]